MRISVLYTLAYILKEKFIMKMHHAKEIIHTVTLL